MPARRSLAWILAALTAAWCPSARASPDEPDPLLRLPDSAPTSPAAWPEAANEISMGFASGYLIATDELASPRRHRGWAWGAPAIRYAHIDDRNTHRVEIESGFAKLEAQPSFEYRDPLEYDDAYSTATTTLQDLRISYAYLRALPTGRHVSLRLGPALDVYARGGIWGAGPAGVPTYFRAIGLHLRGELTAQPGRRHRLMLAFSLPTFAWVSRPPYAVYDDAEHAAAAASGSIRTFFRTLGDGHIQTWNRYRSATLELRYDLRIIRIFALSFGVRTTWLAEQLPRPLRSQDYRGVFGLVLVI